MNKKNDARVCINGKNYNIAGYENVEYLHKIADYINKKQAEIKGQNGSNIINDSEKNILMMINIADDYLKLRERDEEISYGFDDRQKEIANLKRELVNLQTKLDAVENDNKLLRADNVELQKKQVRLETELSGLRRN
ncbi:MAG: cell division protein ZapA [Lachnospiraceae bacterium]|nr:cell division protein ZapA [Lachnospiraceae bacterium]